MQTETLFNISLFYYFIILAFIIPKIPVVGKFFNIINTTLHEFGHAIVALIFQGKVLRIELFGDSGGTTSTQSRGRFGSFLVALAGYPFASTVAYFCFYLISAQYEKQLIIGLSALFFLMLLFWIRNIYGIVWVLCFCLLNTGIIYFCNAEVIAVVALFYATIILTESICSALVVLYISVVRAKEAGDTANLQKITHIPAFFWGLLFTGYALLIGYKVILWIGIPFA